MNNVVKDIIIYPIKGLKGIHVSTAKVLISGFENDRRWMLVDDKNQFITQRNFPQLALFSVAINDFKIKIAYNDSTFEYHQEEKTDTLINTKVWDDDTTAYVVSESANIWFTEQLGQRVKLVKIASETSRLHYASSKDFTLPVSLADGYPYLLVGEESLNFLNGKLSESIKMNRFRPNIVISSSAAHEEDFFDHFSIGTTKFRNIKPCGRCKVITINQENIKINNEVLKILNTYRKSGNNVNFGTNIIPLYPGVITLGDRLYID